MPSSPAKTWSTLFCALILATGCASGVPQNTLFQPISDGGAPFVHVWNTETHPFPGAAVIDADGDGRFEVFVGGGHGQGDLLLRYDGEKLVNIIDDTELSSTTATYGARAIDMDQDGDTDLVVARNDGVFIYLNQSQDGAITFRKRFVPVSLQSNAVPFDVAVGDINNDGAPDLYVSAFVAFPAFKSATFNDPDHAKTNRMLENNGDLTFTDVTELTGTASKNNSFFSVFIDLDMDGWQDLVVAQNTGEVEIFRNLKGITFQDVPTHSGYGFWMGLGIGDVDNDGDQDLFFPNVGTSIAEFLTRGDIRKDQRHTHDWLLLENQGNFQFKEATDQWIPKGEGFAWGSVFEDVNLDGHLDLFVAQNYLKWPPHKWFRLEGRAYLQRDEEEAPRFVPAPQLGLANKYFGQSPLIVDLNDDGRQDFLWINMDGPLKGFINRSEAPFVTVRLPDNLKHLDTRITLITDKGRTYTKQVTCGAGYMTDQTPDISFGLPQGARALKLLIQNPDGTSRTIYNPPVNTRITLP